MQHPPPSAPPVRTHVRMYACTTRQPAPSDEGGLRSFSSRAHCSGKCPERTNSSKKEVCPGKSPVRLQKRCDAETAKRVETVRLVSKRANSRKPANEVETVSMSTQQIMVIFTKKRCTEPGFGGEESRPAKECEAAELSAPWQAQSSTWPAHAEKTQAYERVTGAKKA